MAKRRDLKKDINHFFYSVILECYSYIQYSPDTHFEDIYDILEEVVNLRNDLIHRVNINYDHRNSKQIKEHFKGIVHDLYSKNLEFVERLSHINE